MIILSNPPFFTGHVGPREDSLENFTHIIGIGFRVLRLIVHGLLPFTLKVELGATIVHEIHWEVGYGFLTMFDDECSAIGEYANRCCFYLM